VAAFPAVRYTSLAGRHGYYGCGSLAAAKTLQAKHGYRPPENFIDSNTSKKDLTKKWLFLRMHFQIYLYPILNL
jgi:hypothetical protein